MYFKIIIGLDRKEIYMQFAGLQKTTLLDYPGKLACTIFLGGCNFRCPFCHNTSIILGKTTALSYDSIINFLKKRRGILDGVCITGGEPLINDDIISLIKDIHSMGYSIKLDTNGSFPDKLYNLIDERLLDYVAMDIKNSPEKYDLAAGVKVDIDLIDRSVQLLKQGNIAYEFRTTIVKELHTTNDIDKIGQWIQGAQKYYLQQFKDSGNILCKGYSACSKAKMEDLVIIAKKYVPSSTLRGV